MGSDGVYRWSAQRSVQEYSLVKAHVAALWYISKPGMDVWNGPQGSFIKTRRLI